MLNTGMGCEFVRFLLRVLCSGTTYLNNVIARSDVYFKASNIGFILKYRNVPGMLRVPLPLKRTMEDLIEVARVTGIPVTQISRLINFEEFYLSLPKVRITMSFAEIDNWNPMVEDFHSSKFNSYDTMSPQYDPCTLYVKHVPIDLLEDTFISIMSEGDKKIIKYRILPVKANLQETCAIVTYESEVDATCIKTYLNGKNPFNFDIENAFKYDKKTLKTSPLLKMFGRGRGQNSIQGLKVTVAGNERISYRVQEPNDTRKNIEFSDLPGLVTVCTIRSPTSFWIHVVNDITISQVEKELANIAKVPVKGTVNDICCAMKNGKFYRAQILESRPKSSLLYLIDYGETSSINNDQIYHLPDFFKNYPAEAVCCNLVDGTNHEDIKWTDDDISSFKFHALNKIFVAHVHGLSKNIYNISLINEEGVSLHSVLTLSRHAPVDKLPESKVSEFKIPSVLSSLKIGAEITVAAVEFEGDAIFYGLLDDGSGCAQVMEELENHLQMVDTEEISMTCEEGDIAAGFSVKYNQYYRCVVLKRLRNSFLVRYLDYGNQEEINKLYALKPILLQKKSYVVCCKKPDSLSSEIFKQIFGKACPVTVKSLNDVVILSYEYRNNFLNIHCYPWYHENQSNSSPPTKNPWYHENQSDLSPPTKNPLYHKNQSNSSPPTKSLQYPKKRLSLPGNQSISKSDNVMKTVMYKNLSPGVKYYVKVAFIKDTSELYIHLNNDQNALEALSKSINEHCNTVSWATYSPKVKEIVCCKFSEDGVWYRAEVISNKPNKVKVSFIDYGNYSDNVCYKDIKPLPPKFYQPRFAICVSLHNIRNEDISKTLLDYILNEEWMVEVKDSQKSPVEVMFFKGSKSLNKFIEINSSVKSLSHLQKSPTGKTIDIVCNNEDKKPDTHQLKDLDKWVTLQGGLNATEKNAITRNSKVNLPKFDSLKKQVLPTTTSEVSICFMVDDLFYVHLKSSEELISALDSKLNNATEFQSIISLPEVGDLICAKFTDDIWYRGCVKKICEDSNSCEIHFIDFGNSEVIPLVNLKVLPQHLCTFPVLSIPLKFQDSEIIKNKILAGITVFHVKFLQMSPGEIPIVDIMPEKEEEYLPLVESQMLPESPTKVMEENKYCYSSSQYIPFPPGEQDIVIYCVTDEGFVFCAPYNQEALSANLLLTKEITEYCESLGHNSYNSDVLPDIDQLVLAKYSDDNQWYRAVIVDNQSHPVYDVIFIDYGNSEKIRIESVRRMEKQFMTLDVQAHLCALTGFEVSDEMLPSVVQELKQFTVFVNHTPLAASVSSIEGELSVNIPLIQNYLMEKNLIALK
ncbi:tudor domain-containing protein 1 [Nephila pilipes]|uniref:Tudor domain-containing protein 1 n=1 Tax=Nephila pilipes TaxID=299642 RepID=A0A8X6PZB2_NEPPI|nr:tudor domain-containing protein 1 [Nephila pilipes]